jgi:hypothetical protein
MKLETLELANGIAREIENLQEENKILENPEIKENWGFKVEIRDTCRSNWNVKLNFNDFIELADRKIKNNKILIEQLKEKFEKL